MGRYAENGDNGVNAVGGERRMEGARREREKTMVGREEKFHAKEIQSAQHILSCLHIFSVLRAYPLYHTIIHAGGSAEGDAAGHGATSVPRAEQPCQH